MPITRSVLDFDFRQPNCHQLNRIHNKFVPNHNKLHVNLNSQTDAIPSSAMYIPCLRLTVPTFTSRFT